MSILEKQKAALEEWKQKIKKKEKAIKEREKREYKKMATELGFLVIKAGLSKLSKDTIYGALLEISEKINDEKTLKQWNEKARNFNVSHRCLLILKFDSPPSEKIREIIKSYDFKFNDRRGEYFGNGEKDHLEKIFNEEKCECTIKTVPVKVNP